MNYVVSDIVKILNAEYNLTQPQDQITDLYFDTRTIKASAHSAFIALSGITDNGHNYIHDAYKKGIRTFIISESSESFEELDANFIIVEDTLDALQRLAAHHRNNLNNCIVIGITGSNGKTTVKEWLYRSISDKKKFQSPNSYNSQIGVAISLLNIEKDAEIAIIEAGISQEGEMSKLERMIQPNIGLFLNIGDAHSAGFNSIEDKIEEKLKLFDNTKSILYCRDHDLIHQVLSLKFPEKTKTWGQHPDSNLQITNTEDDHLVIRYNGEEFTLNLSENENFNKENKLHILNALLTLGYSFSSINSAFKNISILPNRLEVCEGKNNNLIINDTYSLDLKSLELALDFAATINTQSKHIVLTRLVDQKDLSKTYKRLNELIERYDYKGVWLLDIPESFKPSFQSEKYKIFNDIKDLSLDTDFRKIQNATILVKGAHEAKLEKLVHTLLKSNHQTCLETNFSALKNNLDIYKNHLDPSTKIMAVLKADAYGSGSTQVANFMAQNQIEYLAVAIVDEGIQIRNSGCSLPILVFNIQESSFENLFEYDLEPEIYSISLFKKLADHARSLNQSIPCHVKLETGLNRLGIESSDLPELLELIKTNPLVKIKSILSHLAASDDAHHDSFTSQQITRFKLAYESLTQKMTYKPLMHILNTSGVLRFKDSQFDMVRLGIGLYGINNEINKDLGLEKVHTLSAQVLQIKELKKHQTTGYGRNGRTEKDAAVAIISIGYADGLLRGCGNGKIQMRINDKLYPTIGNICMDVSMLLLPKEHNVKVGDQVIIFDNNLHIEQMATKLNTISYEIISRLSPRIRRLYTYS